jgi:diguanylate cyclase (GGDEF)-like protein/PAS domain S-box-containing protein
VAYLSPISDGRFASLNFNDPLLLEVMLDAADDAFLITEAWPICGDHPKIVYANNAYLRMTGFDLSDLIGKTPRVAQGPGTDRATLVRIREKLTTWQPWREELLNYNKDGAPFWVEISARPLLNSAGELTNWISVQRDITDRKRAIEALEAKARELEETQGLAKIGTWQWDVDADSIECSSQLSAILGLGSTAHKVSFEVLATCVGANDMRVIRSNFEQVRQLGENVAFEFQIAMLDSKPRTVWTKAKAERDSRGQIVKISGLCQDVTDRRRIERSLNWGASHDRLTGMLNMDGLHERAVTVLASARAANSKVMLALIDIDHLKLVNDTLGHAVGNALIVEAANRLLSAWGRKGFLARMGGDEFVYLGACNENTEELNSSLQELIDLLKQPFEYRGRQLDCTASIGTVLSEPDDAEVDWMLRNADMAMYRAKENGRGTYCFFTSELQDAVDEQVAQRDLAKTVINEQLIVPYFQPQFSLKTGKLVGYEALLRLAVGDRIIPPIAIQHAFDNAELAARLGDAMLFNVLEQIKIWRKGGFQFGSIAVNASAAELSRKGYAERVIQALADADIAPAHLEIEVTEGVLIGRGAERVTDSLRTLKNAGLSVSLDDFGTGYASLTHLKSLPINRIKIDRDFVRDITLDQEDAAIVSATVGLAHALSLDVVAEGVETHEQAEFLRKCGCDIVQGHLFGRAIPAAEIKFQPNVVQTIPGTR